ncbi:hypothetical protein [Abyssalbus ytuae]|uniref:Uncharacterized protein n=1 Tax=Abyssalbus ytuae TaxID=2926907 RepID=A0A9E6ZKP5_9FLAO|nr:hypothetical protein [Abyssalbus ytuae]UOB17507.1 hypothetical protein MQE35_17440 [Abyssalbus ytuae]
METNKALKALDNLYGLLLEMNYHKEPIDFLSEIEEDDVFVSKHLRNVMLRRSKTKALLVQNKYKKLREEFLRLKEYGFEKLQELLTPKEKIELQPLFNKFKELEKKDEIDINEDQDFLIFISKIKDKIDDDES